MNLDFKKIQRNNAYYYVVPSGSKLYKGLVDSSRLTNIGNYEWYGLNIKTSEIYGHIYVFELKKQVLLYAMDEKTNVEQLMRDARLQQRFDVEEAIKITFKLYENSDSVVRKSEPDEDKIVAEFICTMYEGYAIKGLPKGLNSNNYFHSELLLNNAKELVSYKDEKIETEVSQIKVRDYNFSLTRKNRAKYTVPSERQNNIAINLFQESPFKRRRTFYGDLRDLREPEDLNNQDNLNTSFELNNEDDLNRSLELNESLDLNRSLELNDENSLNSEDDLNRSIDLNNNNDLNFEDNLSIEEQQNQNFINLPLRRTLFMQFSEDGALN